MLVEEKPRKVSRNASNREQTIHIATAESVIESAASTKHHILCRSKEGLKGLCYNSQEKRKEAATILANLSAIKCSSPGHRKSALPDPQPFEFPLLY